MINKKEEYIKMAQVEKEHWWYKALHDLTLQQIKKYYHNDKSARIIDAGCGTGGFLEFIKSDGYENIYGLDLSRDAVQFCKEKGFFVIQDDILNITKHFESEKADIIVSNDTLCYFEKNEKKIVLKSLASLLKPKGILIMNLPALDAFKGTHDIAVGIKKRFTKKEILDDMNNSGLKLVTTIYWPFLLSPIIFFTRFFQRITMASQKEPINNPPSDVYLPNLVLNNIFYALIRLENKSSHKPWGSSLMIVLQRTNSGF